MANPGCNLKNLFKQFHSNLSNFILDWWMDLETKI